MPQTTWQNFVIYVHYFIIVLHLEIRIFCIGIIVE